MTQTSNYPIWRWEQGRLDYFDFNHIKIVAQALLNLEGIELIANSSAIFRAEIESSTGLPYLPTTYSVWRNYARVFRAELLATDISGRLTLTDVCRSLAGQLEEKWDADDYFSFLIPRFYYPSPAFVDYDSRAKQVFPICAVIKYLIAKQRQTGEGTVSVDDVFSLLIGNECTGFEPIDLYYRLERGNYRPTADQKRQVREMLIFYSQCSFLKWKEKILYLDIDQYDTEALKQIETLVSPIQAKRNLDRNAEIVSMASFKKIPLMTITAKRTQPTDMTFTEGKKVRVTHLRIERSPHLRKMFFQTISRPILCDMCARDMNVIYPWTVDLLEVHHLLPLSSSIALLEGDTSLKDLVALCPNCHKSVHVYYRNWLRQYDVDDFPSKDHAFQAYTEAKKLVIIE